MRNKSSLNSFSFQLILFTDFGNLRYLFFSLCLLLYMIIICANVVIILTVCLEKPLHEPMYVLICCLSLNSLYGSAGLFPRFLIDIVSETHLISHPSCLIQIYVLYTYVSCEMTFISIMAYDRFVAICQPLHYCSKMTLKTVLRLIVIAELYSAITCGFCVSFTIHLPLCGNKLDRLFCTNWSVLQLSCVDTTVSDITGQVLSVTTICIPLLFVLYTYLRILIVCRRSSSEFRGKALQTCLPHIVTLLTYVLCLISLRRLETRGVNMFLVVFLSLEFLVIPPIVNPLVYGLKLPQIKIVIFRQLKINKKSPSKGFKV